MKNKILVLVIAFLLVGCYGTQETVERRNEVVGQHSAE